MGQAARHKNIGRLIIFEKEDFVVIHFSLIDNANASSYIRKFDKDFDELLIESTLIQWVNRHGSYTFYDDTMHWIYASNGMAVIDNQTGNFNDFLSYSDDSLFMLSSCSLGIVAAEYFAADDYAKVHYFNNIGVEIKSVQVVVPAAFNATSISAINDRFVMIGQDPVGGTFLAICFDDQGNELWSKSTQAIHSARPAVDITPPFVFIADQDNQTFIDQINVYDLDGNYLTTYESGQVRDNVYFSTGAVSLAFNGSDRLYIAYDGATFGDRYRGFIEVVNVSIDNIVLANSSFTYNKTQPLDSKTRQPRGVFCERKEV